VTITKTAVRLILFLLFASAVWIRLESLNTFVYPYFKGESATHYRHASLVADTGGLPDVENRAFWPNGYAPKRSGPTGIEYLTGHTFRVVSVFSDMSLRSFAARWSIVIFSLCVFTFYFLTQQLWRSRPAGLLAAFFVAFSSPLITATFGRDYGHGPYALALTSLHMGLVLAYLRSPSRRTLVMTLLVALVLPVVWASADLYMVLVAAVVLLAPFGRDGRRAWFLAGHLLVMIIAGTVLPHLRDGMAPLAMGEYWLYRLRFLFGKPSDPLALSDAARFLWSYGRTYPSPYTLVAFFLPLIALIVPAVGSLLRFRRERARVVSVAVLLAAGGIVLFLIDRSAIYAAALGGFPLAAAAVCWTDRRTILRIIAVSAACVLMLLQAVVPAGKTNPTDAVASITGLSAAPIDGFVWVSIGDADRDLVRHVVSRTSVKDVFLAPPAISSLLVAFSGRSAALTTLPTVEAMQRTRGYMSKYYDHEDELFGVCDSYGIQYVIYSIDLFLDTSKNSPRYAAGLQSVNQESLAYKMHFEPETLEHFNLVYENDSYRLFRVTKRMEPFFVTDHPPVFQRYLFEQHARDPRTFHKTVVDVLLTYESALAAHQRGDDEEAIRRFRYCVERAPRFTRAWLGAGDSLFRQKEMATANAAYARALESSPDNPHALYNTALTFARLGKSAEAMGLLDVLIASSRDRDTVERARDLKSHIAAGAPLDR
jgi:tetratricopeptide (TPR) repeat protein